jgi:6-pyruvoyl-tetrahydropterin synthase related domain
VIVPDEIPNKKRALLCLLMVAVAATLISLPILVYGAPYGHDMYIHLSWLRNFSAQLHTGDWYPRWLMDLNGGAGSPTFFYYAPLPFFVSGIFGPLLCPGCRAAVHLSVGLWLMLLASGIAFHAFARQYARSWVAAAGAIAYMLMPYHLEIDLWRRFAFGEFPAYIWPPLILLFLDKTLLDRRFLAACAACYAGLFLSHLPEALLVSMFVGAYALMRCVQRRSVQPLLMLASAVAIGAALAAIYIVPAMFAQDYIPAAQLYSPHSGAVQRLWNYDYFHYANWMFFTGHRTPYPSFSNRVFDILLDLTVAFALLCVAVYREKRGQALRDVGPWLLGLALVWFLCTPVSIPLWEHFSLLREVDFPWRSFIVGDLALAMILVVALEGSAMRADRIGLAALALAGAVLAFSMLSGLRHTGSLQPLPKLLQPFQTPAVIQDTAAKVASGWDSLEFFMPVWVKVSPEELRATIGAVPKVDVPRGAGDVRIRHWAPRDIALDVELRRSADITVKQFYFPGWRARSQAGQELRLSASDKLGLLVVHAPAGDNEITLQLEPLWQERVGAAVTALTLVVLALTVWIGWRQRRIAGPARVETASPGGDTSTRRA